MDGNKARGKIISVDDSSVHHKYTRNCSYVQQKYFAHPPATSAEIDFRIAYLIVAYKNAHLVENLLRAVYMPQNIYCLHLDKKSKAQFQRTVRKMIACLPNVFVTSKQVDVIWGHISVL